MHPAIRILCFLITAGSGYGLKLFGQGGMTLFLLAIYLFINDLKLLPVLRMVYFMRWLFLSLLVLFGWFTPGVWLWPSLAAWSPTTTGVSLGLVRLLFLLNLLLMVGVLVQLTRREQIVHGLLFWLTPLRLVGLPPQRIAVRIGLVLDSMETLRSAAREALQRKEAGPWQLRISTLVAELVTKVEARAQEAGAAMIELPDSTLPAWYQWLYPLLLVVLSLFLHWG